MTDSEPFVRMFTPDSHRPGFGQALHAAAQTSRNQLLLRNVLQDRLGLKRGCGNGDRVMGGDILPVLPLQGWILQGRGHRAKELNTSGTAGVAEIETSGTAGVAGD